MCRQTRTTAPRYHRRVEAAARPSGGTRTFSSSSAALSLLTCSHPHMRPQQGSACCALLCHATRGSGRHQFPAPHPAQRPAATAAILSGGACLRGRGMPRSHEVSTHHAVITAPVRYYQYQDGIMHAAPPLLDTSGSPRQDSGPPVKICAMAPPSTHRQPNSWRAPRVSASPTTLPTLNTAQKTATPQAGQVR